ncbi:MAG TPA: hypothetical protein VN688_06095 [Gemmataceae bacterium]|nr:hypothetical protein [Gemmataceae bacterium]
MPFMDEPPGAKLSTTAVVMYGRTVRALRNFTRGSMNKEPEWRHAEAKLTTGYVPPPPNGEAKAPDLPPVSNAE